MSNNEKMVISEKEFIVLSYLATHFDRVSQGTIASEKKMTLDSVNSAINSLSKNDYINKNYEVTESGFEVLKPFKVTNAVIMAAGLSSRFVPLSYEKPKGLLNVNGQVLIERQIEQLIESGITDIYVVVGYMKELFFYLEEKYNVKLIINNDFALRNNNGSIYKVREYLDNTYILSSDDYFTENVFEPYIYNSYYAVEYIHGESTERGVKFNKSGCITETFPNGADCWVLLGHVYWSREFSTAFIKHLDSIYDKPETKPLLWERIFDKFLDKLPPLYIRKYEGIIHEFDSLDELRAFDHNYIRNVDSNIIENICGVLEYLPEELSAFEPLKNGQTNDTFIFHARGQKYVYRHCSVFTSAIVDRMRESRIQKIAGELGIDRTCIALDPEKGWKISHFVEGTNADFNDEEQLKIVINILHKLHESNVTCDWKIDFRTEIKRIHGLINQISNAYSNYNRLREMIDKLLDKVEADNWPLVLCHNDINRDNFIISDRHDLIDWEYAGMNDAAYDIAKLVLKAEVKGDAAKEIIGKYYGRPCTDKEYRHIIACGAIEDYYWLVWAIYLEKNGRNLESSIYTWYKHAMEYGKEALSLYQAK